jgi:polyribonucleotide nucleotidyltransferase
MFGILICNTESFIKSPILGGINSDSCPNFIASLKPGSKYLGIIKKTQGFGVFICFGQADGLLHINNIINDHSKLSNSSNTEKLK